MNRLLAISTRFYKSRVTRIVRDTLSILFPIMLLGSFAEVLKFAFLSPSGFIATLFSVTKWLPFVHPLSQLAGVISRCTIDMIGIYGAYGAAYSTVKEYGKKSAAVAGAVGILSFLMISYQTGSRGRLVFNPTLMGQGLLIALIVGYVCGRVIVTFERNQLAGPYQVIRPLLIILLLSVLANLFISFLRSPQVQTFIFSITPHPVQGNAFPYVIGMGLLTDLLSWLAIGGPYTASPTFTDPPALANLNHALKAGTAYNAPFKYTATTLFHSFANFGGNGVILALIIAIFIFSKRKKFLTVARWSTFPAIFNNNYAMMLGVPILYNPILLIPFLLAPLVNMCVVALFLALNWLPAAVYPVPSGTPGHLIGFIGTNGNWLVLVLGIVLIAIDVLLYAPFVKLYDRLNENAGDKHETTD
ncbi:MAG: PTS transporter subunit EIIC [Lentilactobacillus parabuchneri]|uniref:PTS transporter subunit EIIC n=2 Tax=Lentilactobacillus parabuchneri TaxID=152331 RepID=UPI000A12173E|nr:PTS transporter subunit EIIC [Lentilactobacillus parabuchneri]